MLKQVSSGCGITSTKVELGDTQNYSDQVKHDHKTVLQLAIQIGSDHSSSMTSSVSSSSGMESESSNSNASSSIIWSPREW